MTSIYTLPCEQELHQKLQALFRDWKNAIGAEHFVEDGFYPYYTKQTVKVLFIGREGLTIDANYIDQIYKEYKVNLSNWLRTENSTYTLNSHPFHSKLFYMAYGFQHQFQKYEDIPWANDMRDDFATEKGISFAFMNLSKFSNNSGNFQADWNQINDFIKRTKQVEKSTGRNFFEEEIALLNPDVIITMNFAFPTRELPFIGKSKNGAVDLYELSLADKKIPVFDTFHFSAVKSMEANFYQAIAELYNKYQEQN
ncbi:hypothetical protein CBG46_05175 [Actinobacillus succinogenes]|uniref:Uncharacterized protein n=1 Tax=Actinobacillus succinogenes (strain ATCC 55618 / DSM 22257 / CCUG 43843 / 130Z) TaxID=339671 RepID=A6VKD0_ACTSZ|nr:hypothetical protein [Actinobacillus succinogenes]ABR73427.1 hypothetical protein Asuc_0046 [Actinobacillus succinogenes 130Z]PHI40110.1 hypothetical protein CBG46_05175 [Actinobacillus succinogenes]